MFCSNLYWVDKAMFPGLGPLGRSSTGGGGEGLRCGCDALGPVGAIVEVRWGEKVDSVDWQARGWVACRRRAQSRIMLARALTVPVERLFPMENGGTVPGDRW